MGFKYHKQINKTFNYQKGNNDKEKQIKRRIKENKLFF